MCLFLSYKVEQCHHRGTEKMQQCHASWQYTNSTAPYTMVLYKLTSAIIKGLYKCKSFDDVQMKQHHIVALYKLNSTIIVAL